MQTSYSQTISPGFEGMIADSAEVQDIESCRNPDTLVYIGKLVTKGTADDEIIQPSGATMVTDEKLVKGIVVHAQEFEVNRFDTLLPNYKAKSVVPVMRKGRIWVKAEDTITVGTSTVNARYAAGAGGTYLGALRGASVTNETAVVPKSKWKTSTSGAGQMAILEIDL